MNDMFVKICDMCVIFCVTCMSHMSDNVSNKMCDMYDNAHLSWGDDVQKSAHPMEEHGQELYEQRDAEYSHEEQRDGF